MKRTALKRKTRLRPLSKKRSADMREYSRLRKEFLSLHPICAVWLRDNDWREDNCPLRGRIYVRICAGGILTRTPDEMFHYTNAQKSEVIHHKHKRGKNYLNTDTWLALSERNHARVEGDYTYDGLPYGKSWAREQGYLANI